ncbi:cystathionine beta-lyase [Cupriavidus basilensis]|uniref:Cystathionine beta-lyase n=1 Tax=Cupriavidus basilensis TaxID=68895 RepID=A0ABT6AXX9_9BURK|nr:cystathionine beta-lyase [Cupriavidus basilensis]MDF3837453.1 cystathionine beta-lyase [Cupriavidus basilensis]
MSHHRDTRLIHAGTPPFSQGHGPVNVPVVRASTVRFESAAAYDDIRERHARGERVSAYGRQGMETHRALEDAIAALEGGDRTFLVPSGLAAISLTFVALLSPGDHALVVDSVYAPVRRLEQTLLRRLGIEVSYFSPGRDDVAALIRPNTKLLYLESPSSLLYEVLDLPRLAQIAHRHGVVVAADNTWASGHVLQPLALGVDVSILAATKYISGHSDLMQGALVVRDAALVRRLADAYDGFGLAIGADDAYLALRGIRTLAVRLAQHQRNALAVAHYLEAHAAVGRVFYPALPSDPGHALWLRDFSGANGLVSFSLPGADAAGARKLVDSLRLFGLGASWGGYESLVQVAAPERLAEHSYWRGTEPVIRLHIGLEAADDLIADLEQGLAALPQRRAAA